MAFPGGRQDPKETDRETVQRETLEEIGLDLCSKAGYIGQLDDAQASENLSVGVYVYRLAPSHVDVEFQLDPSEISDVLWVKLDYFLTNPIQQVITLRLVDFAEHLRPMEWLLRYCRMDRIDFPCIYLPRPKEVQIHETKRLLPQRKVEANNSHILAFVGGILPILPWVQGCLCFKYGFRPS